VEFSLLTKDQELLVLFKRLKVLLEGKEKEMNLILLEVYSKMVV
jgi:hypothetical protein